MTSPAHTEGPEATEAVCDKMMPGFGELMRTTSLKFVPTAILSRQTAGIRGASLIVNLPGSPKGALESFEVVVPLLELSSFESSFGIHSHGDGLMHIHPFTKAAAGEKATVGRFIADLRDLRDRAAEETLADGASTLLDEHFGALGGWISATLVRLGDLRERQGDHRVPASSSAVRSTSRSSKGWTTSPTRWPGCWPRKKSWGCCRAGWSSVPARLAAGRAR